MVVVGNLAEYLPERIKTHELVRVPASEVEYSDIAPAFPGKLEYHNGEIMARGPETVWHGVTVANTSAVLSNFYYHQNAFVVGSNACVHTPEGGCYQRDSSVVLDQPLFYGTSDAIFTNPFLLVDVVSSVTARYDHDEKLPYYKALNSLKYVVSIAQTRPFVSVYERTDKSDVWLSTDYKTLDSVAKLGDLTLPLREIYRKIQFSQT